MESTIRLSQLMSMAVGERPKTRAQETMLTVLAIAAALVLASVWGIGAGSSSARLALENAYKVPMVILLSAVCALPAGLVTLRLTGARLGGAELASAFAASIFGGTLVLATLAPLVALYYHTSAQAGVPLALGSVFVSLASASIMFARNVARRMQTGDDKTGRAASRLAVGVLVVIFLAALLQFVALASPIIGVHGTALEGGIDGALFR